ncbi:hypothetical protein M1L60_38755, partial [Actinoplanes sp. TRM 88003]
NWHWLIKHPVEFSKNNRYPANRSGALARLYLGFSFSSNPGNFPEIHDPELLKPARIYTSYC